MNTYHTNDEILDTFTEHRRRHLPLDELQSLIEADLGMSLEREGFTGDEGYASGKLIGKSPTGVVLFSIMVYETEGRGWQVGGQGDFLDQSRDTLYGLHQEPVEVSWVRREGQVVMVRRLADGHLEEQESRS
ncbi:MAG: hypothetical protein AAGC60_05495 [Acidobacteriota bacterium]